jgi:hypothetical protein
MHNTDRTQQFLESAEYPQEAGGPYEYAQEYPGEYPGEYAGEYPGEYPGEYAGEYSGEYPGEYAQESAEVYGEIINAETGEVNETFEMAMAAELLEVNSEEELDRFLGKLVRGIGRGFKKFARSGIGRALGGALKGVAKAALPTLGGALGSLIPIPGVGTALGAAAGNLASKALDSEGLSHEDRMFEVARRVVRIGVESGRAVEELPQGEYSQAEIGGILSGIARAVLPSAASSVLGAITGQAATGAQGTGGLLGNINIQSPGGWRVSAGGQAGGQVTAGTAIGLNAPAPSVPFQPSPPRQVLPPYGPRPGGGSGPVPGRHPQVPRGRHGRWVRRGHHILLLNAY